MINFDDVTKENRKEHHPNCAQIPDHLYRILLIGGYGSGKTNSLINLTSQQPDIDKIHFNAKDPYEAKYQNIIQYNTIQIEEYNSNKKHQILIVFDDMITDMLSNKKLNPIVTELFIRGRKLNISLVCNTQFYFTVPKNRLNSTHYFIMKIPNKRELQQIAINHSSDIDFRDFMNLYKKCTIDATLASDNPSCFRMNLLERI